MLRRCAVGSWTVAGFGALKVFPPSMLVNGRTSRVR